ncbi:hypothetical protein B0T13DRAFT_496107 [Neurospora crassa]|nr:hypothetical protein B0T13DRAFT_496107 [Neurospora crassa]
MTCPAVLNSDCEVPAISGLPAAAEEPPVRTDIYKLSVRAQANEENKAVLASNDKHVQLSTHNENDMAADGASINRLTTDVTDFHISNGAATESTVVENPSPRAERSPAENQSGTLGSHVNSFQVPNDISNSTLFKQSHINHAEGNKLDLKPTSTAVTSTEPVGIYYPPRRPNIFRARAKHIRFPEHDQNPVVSDAVDKPESIMAGDCEDFSFEDLEEFQSRVEDLGTVQEIEEPRSSPNDFEMFRALQHHRALARANEQREAAIDTPIHHSYQQTEAQPFRRVTLRDCFPQTNKPTDSYKQITTDNLITSNTLDKSIAQTDSKNASSVVETSNMGQNDLVGPLTSSFSTLQLAPTPYKPSNGYNANWLTASPFSTATPKHSTWTTDTRVALPVYTPTTVHSKNTDKTTEFPKSSEMHNKQQMTLPTTKGQDRATVKRTIGSSIHSKTDNGSASKPRLSRREQRKLASLKWSNNAFIDEKSRLDTKMNRLGKMRKRLHHRCTWVKKPFSLREFVHRAEQPVPFLVLTDPEGGKHFLEDPKKYKN